MLAMQARSLAVTDPTGALALLASIDLDAVPAAVRALIRQICTYANFRSGDREGMIGGLNDLIGDPTTPQSLRQIAAAQLMMLKASSGHVPMRSAVETLASMAREQVANGQHYFGGISYHNALACALAQGDYVRAVEFGRLSLSAFGATGAYNFEAQSTRAGLYVGLMELGVVNGATSEMEAVLASDREADADAYADIASVRAIIGDTDDAMRLLADARRRLVDGWTDLAAPASVAWAEALVLLATGQAVSAVALLEALPESTAYVPGHASVQALRVAVASFMADLPECGLRADQALDVARAQGAWAYEARALILKAATRERREGLRVALTEGDKRGALVLTEMADVVGRSLYLLDPLPVEVIGSIQKWPDRWLPVLRRTLEGSHKANARAAASLLAQYGVASDAPRLAAYDRTNRKHLKGIRFARDLAERVSDHLHIRDLGRVEYRIGDRIVRISDTRRKASALLAYLVTRPGHTATREQVLDDIWPDSDPQAAANSLHQTLYFLRRDIDPWYDDESSASYVLHEGEMLWLSGTLVFPESWAFDSAAASALLPSATLKDQIDVLAMYRGRFAPDFEYEEWSLAWRDRLHAAYLALAKATFKRLVSGDRHEEAVRLCQVALATDPDALDIEQALIWAYCSLGSDSAASKQYAHFAHAHQSELGVDPPSLTSLRGLPLDDL
ncbi:MAG: winged helix-turn-helix domain-containing protein [Chloroflexi bacterium]|nr:winged helix-turn-helix domain-containing protein [Chloroflexota bacterium]